MDTENFFWQEKVANGIRIGLNNQGRDALGNVKFVDLPDKGTTVEVGSHLFDVEAEKTVLDLDSPLSGKIIQVNDTLEDNPDFLDDENKEQNWLFVIE